MSIKGDMAQALRSKFLIGPEQAASMVKEVLEAAADPSFASRYAVESGGNHETEMANYWHVIDFLKETI